MKMPKLEVPRIATLARSRDHKMDEAIFRSFREIISFISDFTPIYYAFKLPFK